MEVLFNFIVIFFVGLIAYWWANQGLLSAILHFVAVVCAGAIALAFWEPIVVNWLLNNTGFDNYAWGVTLVGLFVVSLAIIRVAFDKLAPGNVTIPNWANLLFGGVFGVGSGILTVGILMIAIGMTQFSDSLLNVKLKARGDKGMEPGDTLWVPAHAWTVKFYNFVSTGAFYPDFTRKPLQQVYPDLHDVAWSHHRDSFKSGTAKTSIVPDAVNIGDVVQGASAYFVTITVGNKGYDRASEFVMSSSQIRLIAYEGGRVSGEVHVAHPNRWTQLVRRGGQDIEASFLFDDRSHYVTSIPGRQQVTFQVEFPIGGGQDQVPRSATPKYVQIKGVRFAIDRIQRNESADARGVQTQNRAAPSNPNAPMARAEEIMQRFDIRPINSLSINNIQGRLDHTDRYLVEGEMSVRRGSRAPNRDTRIQGIWSSEDTEIVRVDVSRSSTCNIYSPAPAREKAGENAAPKLVDSEGIEYLPKGFIHAGPEWQKISLTPGSLIRDISTLPHLPTSNTQQLYLIYEVTLGARITSFRLDDVTVANCDVTVQFR